MEECVFKNICRACLTEEGEFKSVFVSEESLGIPLHISEMMSACASVQVTVGDGLPELICGACATNTVNMYLFKLKIEKSDTILREKLQKLSVYYQEEFSEQGNESNKEVIKPEMALEGDTKPFQSEIVLEEFDNFDFDSYNKSDSEDFPEPHNVEEVNTEEITLKQQNNVKKFDCTLCQKQFTRNDLLLRHKIAHAMKMNEQNMGFDDTFQMEENDQTPYLIKSEEFMFSCTECDVIFVHKDDLDIHITQEHGKKEETTSCELCMKKFSKLAHLNRHIRTFHSGIKAYKCPLCKKRFMRQEQLTHHMNIHSGIKPHICNICFKGI